MRRRTSSACVKTSKPATRAVPDVAGRKQDKIRMVVLLPAPLLPSKPTISPRATVKEMFETAVFPAYRLVRLETSIINSSLIRQCCRLKLSRNPPSQPSKITGFAAGAARDAGPSLTMPRAARKSNAVSVIPDSFYAQWRARRAPGSFLQEDHGSYPSEQLLQAIWQHQRLLREQLVTLDDRKVRILHPGFKNHEAGPDFRGAMVQIEGDSPRSGDVEVDLRPGGWRAHGHDRNPAFKQVILQVVWEGAEPADEKIPALALSTKLDAPLAELGTSLGREALQSLPEDFRGQCSAPLRELPKDRLADLLHQAAAIRLQNKAAQIQSRSRQCGWEQALWEGLFRALGYKQNIWPMQSLAECRSRWHAPRATALDCQARLFGVSGLLPADGARLAGGPGAYH